MLTEDKIHQAADRESYLKGCDYFARGRVKKLYRRGNGIFEAEVQGSLPSGEFRGGFPSGADRSSTYGKWFGVVLSAEKNNMLYIPEGFAHGFLVLSDVAEFSYYLSEYYHPEDESGIPWNDEAIGVEWPIPEGMKIITSPRDSNHPPFRPCPKEGS